MLLEIVPFSLFISKAEILDLLPFLVYQSVLLDVRCQFPGAIVTIS